MNTKNTILLIVGLISSTLFFSCSKDQDIQFNDVEVSMKAPEGIQDYAIENATLKFTEINTGIVTSTVINPTTNLSKVASSNTVGVNAAADGIVKFSDSGASVINDFASTLPNGTYDVTLEGSMRYNKDGQAITSKVRGSKNGIVINGPNVNIQLDLFIFDETAGLILKEIFFTGTVTPENKSYNGDKYFIIYNNSDETLYADGLIISEAAFLTTTKREYTPNIMNEAFTAGSIIMVPGTGKQSPILPGKQIVIANNAIDHIEYNPNSLDLRNAEFEIDLISTINVDNPQVTNMISVNGTMLMNNRGFKSYVLARLPEGMTIDNYKTDHLYTYSYLNALGNPVNSNSYKIPNTYILDAVNLSVETDFEWILTSPQLDMGWTYCGRTSSDATRYGKSVLRKVLTTNPDGRVIYQDTNNSSVDFTPESKPSLMK
ncbi:DUF4876 domain-containing protein [Sphingobacterium rhinopitheci]|uniref:DUF4876 domain-containing protein n=1 Tax=Sphingobacterium rhinopitheci TaxID=2781960 RepID=UPI001F52418A|nr:DUF4876 domain-containing protein [Sphingobacterium rhinopitheci]MCI0921527.1 DUF4876 domain-containing protein [Sphingobacterium rhinopitheci]